MKNERVNEHNEAVSPQHRDTYDPFSLAEPLTHTLFIALQYMISTLPCLTPVAPPCY